MTASSPEEAIRNAYAWFEVNSGWAQPDDDNLAEWVADGVCRCPDDCIVSPDGWCEHGLASWWLIVQSLAAADRAPRPGRNPQDQRGDREADDRVGAGDPDGDRGGRQHDSQ